MINVGTASEEQNLLDQNLERIVTEPQTCFWQYSKPAVVLGRGQRPDDEMIERAGCKGIELVRRAAGGGAVIAGPWMLSATTFVPPDHPLAQMSLPQSFDMIGSAWNRALNDMGIETELVNTDNLETKRAAFKDNGLDWVCFAGLSYGEITDSENRKLVGLAQVRKKNGTAVVSGVLVDRPDWESLTDIWHGPEADNQCKRLDELTTYGRQLSASQQDFSDNELTRRMGAELWQLGINP